MRSKSHFIAEDSGAVDHQAGLVRLLMARLGEEEGHVDGHEEGNKRRDEAKWKSFYRGGRLRVGFQVNH